MSQSNDSREKYREAVNQLFRLQREVEKPEHETKDEEDLAWQIKQLEDLEEELFGLDA